MTRIGDHIAKDRAPPGGGRPLVRPFRPGDAAAVRKLFITVNRLLAPPHLATEFEAYIAGALREEIDHIACYYAARNGQFFVAMAAGELVGMFGLEQAEPDAAELRRMYVDPGRRRSGIERDLLARAETEARKAGFTRLILSTSELQPAALALYRSGGFRLVREEIATRSTNKTLGGSIRRFNFEKALTPDREQAGRSQSLIQKFMRPASRLRACGS